jgi:lipoprotein NlpD
LRRPRGRRVIGLGLLLPGLLLASPGLDYAQAAAAKHALRKAATKQPSVERKVRPGTKKIQMPRRNLVHVVRPGETLSRIAVHYGVNRQAIITANRLTRSERLRRGQRLSIPRAQPGAGAHSVFQIDRVESGGDVLLVRAGSRRVPTRLSMIPPELDGKLGDLVWPIEGRIVSPFGKRRSGWHAGADIQGELGTPILAAAKGVVVASGQEGGYGRVIRIEHEGGLVTVYAHNLENLVEIGDRVSAGTIIATVGQSGRASAPHLHFEIRYEDLAYNPLQLLPPREMLEIRTDDAPDEPAETARARTVGDADDE